MRLVIVRHGKAEKAAPTGRDGDRVLSLRGREQARHLGEVLSRELGAGVLLLSSGLCRAVQTARIIQDQWLAHDAHDAHVAHDAEATEDAGAQDAVLQLEPVLETGHAASDAAAVIESRLNTDARGRPTLIVGHNPQLEELVSLLAPDSGGHVTLRTGEAAVLEAPDGGAAPLVENCRLLGLVRMASDDRD